MKNDLKDAVQILKRLRAEMHETQEVSLVRKMDEVISRLEVVGREKPEQKWIDESRKLLSRGVALYTLCKTLVSLFGNDG